MFKNVIVKPIILKNSPSKIHYGCAETQYGQLFLAHYFEENPYICYAHFTNEHSNQKFTNDLLKLWPNSELVNDDKLTREILKNFKTPNNEINVVLNGTDFQKKVWSALMEIPFGEERTYGELAVAIGNPKAVRAVASAVGSNDIAIFIPCHRVKAKTGDLHKYRWGADLKKKIMLDEQ